MSIENFLYKTLNPVMKALFRSPLHGIASGSIAKAAPELVPVEVELD